MGPRSETHAVIDLSATAPWVWPATAAILVGGLVVVSSLVGAAQSQMPSAAGQRGSVLDQESFDSEGRLDVRAN
jgi:hypothetical protein